MTTKQLLTQIEAYLKPTGERQYAVVVSRRLLVHLREHLREMLAATSTQSVTEPEKPPDAIVI